MRWFFVIMCAFCLLTQYRGKSYVIHLIFRIPSLYIWRILSFLLHMRKQKHRSSYYQLVMVGLGSAYMLSDSKVLVIPLPPSTWARAFWFCFYFNIFYKMWTIFKVFIEFVTILLLFHVLVFWQQGVWDLSSPTRDRNRTLCTGRWMLNPWNARDVPRPPTFSCDFAAPSFKKDYMKRNREKSCHLRFSRTTYPQQTHQGPQQKVQPWGRPAEKSPIWAQP